MDYELGHINELYHAAVGNKTPDEDSAELLKELNGECARIITLMLHSNLPEEIIKVIIRRHHRSIYLLLNCIEKDRDGINSTNEKHSQLKIDLLNNFSRKLIQFTDRIRDYFSNLVDHSQPLSIPELKITAQQLASKLEQISTHYAAQDAITDLLKMTISPINLINIKASYSQAEYLDKLLDKLIGLNGNSAGHSGERILNLLIEHGFNSPAFYSYCCIEIIKKRDACNDVEGSYRELFWIQKMLNQIIPFTDRQFYRSLPEIRTSLLNFTQAEINHLDNLEKIAGDLAGGGKMQENFKVSLSVKELGFFIHLQVECGVIIEDRPKKIHEYVAGHYSTKETEKISAKSFKNAYYSHAKEDVAKVTAKLAEMLARAQQKM